MNIMLPYLTIVLLLILTGAGLPMPEEVPIVAAGVLASGANPEVRLNVWIALICCVVGALLGDMLVYTAGRLLGNSFFRRHKWYAMLMHEGREKQMEDLIRRHGLKAFFAARFMIGVRAPIYMAAGVMRVPVVRFMIVDGIAATVVVSIVFGLSFRYGSHISRLVREFSIGVTAVGVVAVLTAVAVYFWRRRHRQPPAAGGLVGASATGQDERAHSQSTAEDSRAARMSA